MKTKNIILYCFVIVILIIVFNWRSREIVGQLIFDATNSNPTITTQSEIDSILSEFEKIQFQNLDSIYLSATKSNAEPFKRMLKSTSYYIVYGGDKYIRIVNNFRIKDFMPNDSYNKKS